VSCTARKLSETLRSLIVQLEFVRDDEPDTVLATCITYVGFVGILTGVARKLSETLRSFRTPVRIPTNPTYVMHVASTVSGCA
jgi:hypothetical protein